MTLHPMTWAQAHNAGLATARGFTALGIPASTIRRWAATGRIQAAGKAPGGAHLYPIAAVSHTAQKTRTDRTTRSA